MNASALLNLPKPVILVIEDELEIRRFLRASLETHDYQLIEAGTSREGLAIASVERPSLVLLDLGLPDDDGHAVIRKLRGWSQVPIIVLSARGQESDKVTALNEGADDYLTKPFSVGELLARIRVALRHADQAVSQEVQPKFEQGGLLVDLEMRRVTLNNREIHLTPIEYKLLAALIRHAGKVVTHRQLLKEVWGPDAVMENHYLRVYMTHLRRKVETDSARPKYLLTEPGIGYRLAVTG